VAKLELDAVIQERSDDFIKRLYNITTAIIDSKLETSIFNEENRAINSNPETLAINLVIQFYNRCTHQMKTYLGCNLTKYSKSMNNLMQQLNINQFIEINLLMQHIQPKPAKDINNKYNVINFYAELEEIYKDNTDKFHLFTRFTNILHVIPGITVNLLKKANDKYLLASQVETALNEEETQQRATIQEMIQEEYKKFHESNILKMKNLQINRN